MSLRKDFLSVFLTDTVVYLSTVFFFLVDENLKICVIKYILKLSSKEICNQPLGLITTVLIFKIGRAIKRE